MVVDLGGCRSSSHTHYILYITNSTGAQARGADAKQKHKHGSCRGQQLCTGSGSAAADDLGSGQQGGSSADPGVDKIELFLPHMYVFPCVRCTGIKLALAHTFTFARVHPA